MSQPEKVVEIQIPVPWSDRPITVIIYGLIAATILSIVSASTIFVGFRLLS